MGPRPEQYRKKGPLSADQRNFLILEEIQLEKWLDNLSFAEREIWGAYVSLSWEHNTVDTDAIFYHQVLKKHNMPLTPQGVYGRYLSTWSRLHLL